MNAWQITQNLVWSLSPQRFTWADSPSQPVLARVAPTPVDMGFFTCDAAAPFALVHPEVTRGNPEHPADLVDEARWSVYLYAANATDQQGGAALVGGNRQSLGQSQGRGVLEVAPYVQKQLFNQLGLTARPRAGGTQPPDATTIKGVVAEMALDVVATRIPQLPDYAPVQKLKNTFASPTLGVCCDWSAALSRYDMIGYTWARASGSTAPTDPTAGTFVACDPSTYQATVTINGMSLTGWQLGIYTGSFLVVILSNLGGSTPTQVASLLASSINTTTSTSHVTATASGATVTITLVSGFSRLAVYPVVGSTPGQVTVISNTSLIDLAPGSGTFSYSVWFAYDATRDPSLSIGASTPNRWSSQETAQNGVVYLPASITVTA